MCHPLFVRKVIIISDVAQLRQVILRGNGREKPAFLISNDFEAPVEMLVGNYARRWRVENVIAEAVKFFNLNALSSPILVKVHFDVIMTMIADTFFSLLARKLRGFENCDAAKIYRLFVKGKAHCCTKLEWSQGKMSQCRHLTELARCRCYLSSSTRLRMDSTVLSNSEVLSL